MKKVYDSVKTTKTADLILIFMDEEAEISPLSFRILDVTIPVNKTSMYKLTLKDNSLYEHKNYDCFLDFGNEKVSYSIKVNYDQENYYIFGRKKNSMSFEIIFGDFVNDKIDNNKCYIEYDGKKYFSHDDKNFKRLRCLNLVNVDLNLVKFPLSYKNEIIKKNIFDDRNFFIFISVAGKEPKVFGIYKNIPFEEKDEILDANSVSNLLTESLSKIKKILKYNKDKTYKNYLHDIDENQFTSYVNEIKNSVNLENKIIPFFNFYRPHLTKEEIIAFDNYSEFIIAFPAFQFMKPNSNKIIPYKFYSQYYYSKKAIENFMKTIPDYVEEEQRILLKYSACRCLRSILREGKGLAKDDLFYFVDLTKEKSLYNDARKFNEAFIKELNEDSEMFLFLLQINSGSSINKLNNDLTARISMLKLEQIKEHLRESLPKYIIRINSLVDFYGLTINESRHSIISEIDLFEKFLNKEELEGFYDENNSRRLILANLLQHECFGHVNYSLNFYAFKRDTNEIKEYSYNTEDEPLSPRQYFNIGNKSEEQFIEIVVTTVKFGEEISNGESGFAFNIFLTRGNEKNLNALRNNSADFSKIFKEPKLFAAKDLTELNKLIYESCSDEDFQKYQLKKVSLKYEIKRYRRSHLDNRPTIAKYY